MRVRLLVDWADAGHPFTPAGAVLDVEPATARQLLHGARAEPVRMQSELAALDTPQTATRKRGKKRRRK